MIDRAAKFAEQAHRGAHRKGTRIPYIVHPLETALIASMLTNDEEILAAALLHDTIEDTDVTYEDLKQEFGTRGLRIWSRRRARISPKHGLSARGTRWNI